jgi:PPP family 3-phenylpropionic acid transporter
MNGLMTSDSNKFAIGSQYFIYFGVLGVFLPYFNLYCYRIGFTGWEIGILSAVRSVVMVLFPLLWGALADRLNLRKPIYVFCNVISTAVWAAFLFTAEFKPMLLIMVSYAIFHAPIISFLEAFTMDVLGGEKKSYGRLRVWGSIGFIAVVLVLGKLIEIVSIEIIVVLVLGGSALLSLISPSVPRLASRSIGIIAKGGSRFLKPRVIIFLTCAFLMLVSHGTYYGFFSIHLENLGYPSAFIGAAWALASGAEIIVMIQSERIFNRFSLERVLFFSFGVAVVRWLILYFAESGVLILLSQGLHAVTYGSFHMASILYIDRMAPEDGKTMGQAVNNALTYGLGLMVGFFLNGYLYERTGSYPLFLISAAIAALAAALFAIGQLAERKAHSA